MLIRQKDFIGDSIVAPLVVSREVTGVCQARRILGLILWPEIAFSVGLRNYEA